MAEEFLKFNEHGQWSLTKYTTIPTKQGGVRQDFPRPEVGTRGHQGKTQAIGTTNVFPAPPRIKNSFPETPPEHNASTGEGNRGKQGIKLFTAAGQRTEEDNT